MYIFFVINYHDVSPSRSSVYFVQKYYINTVIKLIENFHKIHPDSNQKRYPFGKDAGFNLTGLWEIFLWVFYVYKTCLKFTIVNYAH